MNILVLNGSPSRAGNTETIVNHFIQGAQEVPEANIEKIDLNSIIIKPCLACDCCLTGKSNFCVIHDDMLALYDKFIQANVVVFASPIYWWSISAQLKLFIDRLYGLNFDKHPEHFTNKKLVIILTYRGKEPNSGADLAVRMFEEIAEYTKMVVSDIIRYYTGEKHAAKCPEIFARALLSGRSV